MFKTAQKVVNIEQPSKLKSSWHHKQFDVFYGTISSTNLDNTNFEIS